MSFTVAYAGAGINRREFAAYVRLLEKRGIDWSNTSRVQEPGPTNRWLYVWSDRGADEGFRDDLKAETRDDSWYVQELASGTQASSGSLVRVVLLMRRNSLGANFSLHPHSWSLVQRRFPEAQIVSSISIEWSSRSDFEHQQGSFWDHVAQVLTGLSMEQLETLEGYQVYDLMSERVVYDSEETLAVQE